MYNFEVKSVGTVQDNSQFFFFFSFHAMFEGFYKKCIKFFWHANLL